MVRPAVFFSHLINSSVVTVWKVGVFRFRPEEKIKKSVPNCLCQVVKPGNIMKSYRGKIKSTILSSLYFLREQQQQQISLCQISWLTTGKCILYHVFTWNYVFIWEFNFDLSKKDPWLSCLMLIDKLIAFKAAVHSITKRSKLNIY